MENFWKKVHKILFFGLLGVAIFFGGYVWNRSLYYSTWSSEKKQDFINAQEKGTTFNEINYKKALDIIKKRNEQNRNMPNVGRNPFE
ncbi:MAG: hypothetical protein HGA61_00860 [Candidatus Moranbacteria bacterium]|nr:hypothetical protein [Candidatus Moranbacteria bacterium]